MEQNEILIVKMQISLNKSMLTNGNISDKMYAKADKILQNKLTNLLSGTIINRSEKIILATGKGRENGFIDD